MRGHEGVRTVNNPDPRWIRISGQVVVSAGSPHAYRYARGSASNAALQASLQNSYTRSS
jgi:hypothetical protein